MDSQPDNVAATPDAVSKPRRIAVLTAGGDAPGMNAAIRSVVRSAAAAAIEVVGVRRGYDGLIDRAFEPLSSRTVANVIQRGGTMLETSRSSRFRIEAGRADAARNLKAAGIDALVVIGGEGALAGARVFSGERGIRTVVIPASIDNDVPGTSYSIGFDTAVNTALDAIDRVRDTAFAADRLFFIEVMGRDSGFIALEVALGGGAEAVIVPEIPFSIDDLCRRLADSQARGKKSSIVVISEGPRTGGAMPIATLVAARLKMPARTVVLGHIQRGGAPTARDRLAASLMGAEAVRAIIEGAASVLIAEERGGLVRVPLATIDDHPRRLDPGLLELIDRLGL